MHLKRYLAPDYWKLHKKEKAFAVTPRPGPHPKNMCIPISIILRDILKCVKTGRESKRVIKAGKVIVDKKVRKDPNFPVGLMDVVEIPDMKKVFRVDIDKHGLFLKEINPEDSDKKLCRIKGKRSVKKGLTQLTLHDGRNILTKDSGYKVGDSLLIKIPEQTILKHFKLEKDIPVIVISGKNMGAKGKIKEIYNRKTMLEKSRVLIETKDGEIETSKDYVMVGEI
jgi:small subunit ribosomal protein S4e